MSRRSVGSEIGPSAEELSGSGCSVDGGTSMNSSSDTSLEMNHSQHSPASSLKGEQLQGGCTTALAADDGARTSDGEGAYARTYDDVCPICLTSWNKLQSFSLPCGHNLCLSCGQLLASKSYVWLQTNRRRNSARRPIEDSTWDTFVLCPLCREACPRPEVFLASFNVEPTQRCESVFGQPEKEPCGRLLVEGNVSFGRTLECRHWICAPCWLRSRQHSSFCPAGCHTVVSKAEDLCWLPAAEPHVQPPMRPSLSDHEAPPSSVRDATGSRSDGEVYRWGDEEQEMMILERANINGEVLAFVRRMGGAGDERCFSSLLCSGRLPLFVEGDTAVFTPCGHWFCLPCWTARHNATLCPYCQRGVQLVNVRFCDGYSRGNGRMQMPAIGDRRTSRVVRTNNSPPVEYRFWRRICFLAVLLGILIIFIFFGGKRYN